MTLTPTLLTFDIFGTVLDWRTGLYGSCERAGRPLKEGEFDRIVDDQGELEGGAFLDYATITSRSVMNVIGLSEAKAQLVGAEVGRWPLYPDARVLSRLMDIVPCMAMTNSDRLHGEDIQAQLCFRLSDWLCAEEAQVYKPNPDFWHQMSARSGVALGRDWWHVSAYADYDLAVANELGLTSVFVDRPHSRPGPAAHTVRTLTDLLALVAA
ncbi:hypothetical protein [Phenylobacterium sp.]|uniref:hypothetical protein n=1 Tax=Phenylobacterium sp. TaxID=1871053 RepID=UPI00121C0CE3|nr:hypothetical protein [Phenylobacterium sp.]THD60092.1 MAG: hypothetical protein E8A49_14935 [Phenylobacterium sp.]